MMNYSDYDSEDYSSNEDEDYVPSDDNLSEDDLNECEKEDCLDGEDQAEQCTDKTKKKKKLQKGLSVRKRKKGGLKLEGGDEGDGDNQKEEDGQVKVEQPVTKSKVENENKQKKKADDLWASFLKDVGPRPKAEMPVSEQSKTEVIPQEPTKVSTEPSRITITKVFDFAGEEVRVTKEVDADSKEAKSFMKKEEKTEENREQQMSPSKAPSSLTPGPSVKRPTGMGSVLNRIGGKKQKMSTLEKSKLDWNAFKEEEGITDELAIHNRGKEGYVERKNFLERVDQRQFELEKNVRLSNMKR